MAVVGDFDDAGMARRYWVLIPLGNGAMAGAFDLEHQQVFAADVFDTKLSCDGLTKGYSARVDLPVEPFHFARI